jgi:hypothetical protein
VPPAIQEATSPRRVTSNDSRATYARPSHVSPSDIFSSLLWQKKEPDSAASETFYWTKPCLESHVCCSPARQAVWMALLLKFSFRRTMARLPLPLAIFRSQINPSFLSLLRPMIYKPLILRDSLYDYQCCHFTTFVPIISYICNVSALPKQSSTYEDAARTSPT